MRKGKALLEARKIFGPSGHVRYKPGLPFPCVVGRFDHNGWSGVAVGKTWDEALEGARRDSCRRAA